LLYEFICQACDKLYEELSPYDPSGEYPNVACPVCNSTQKTKKVSRFSMAGRNVSLASFSYRAGFNMERAKGERRAAEEMSHMGGNPYTPLDDTPLDTGIHDNEAPIRL
jgi:putative FmdB family regulatory protein